MYIETIVNLIGPMMFHNYDHIQRQTYDKEIYVCIGM